MDYFLTFLQNNGDYVSFIYGLAYVFSGGIAFLLHLRKSSGMAWIWLSLFLILHGLHHWLDLIALNFALSALRGYTGTVLDLLALSAGFLFVRRIFPLAIVVYLAAVSATLIFALLHPWAIALITLAFLLIPSLVLASAAFWKLSDPSKRKIFRAIALALGMQALITLGAVVFFILGALDQKSVSLLTGFWGAGFGFLFFALLWNYAIRYEDDSDKLPAATPWQASIPILAAGVILAAGSIFVDRLGEHRTKLLESELLRRATVVANSLDPAQIRLLTATEADIGTPAYEEIKKHLAHTRVISRFLYLITLREGKAVIMVDSEPPDSPDYSPAGQIYTEISDAYLHALRAGKPSIIGPVSDRWGTWVTAAIPLPATLKDGSLIYLGADMDATRWEYEIRNSRFMGIVIVLLFCILLLYLYWSAFQILRINARLHDEIGLFVGGPTFVMKWVYADSVFRILYGSPNINSLIGYSADDIISGRLPFSELIHPDDRDALNTLLRTLSEKPGQEGEIELRLLNAQGSYRWFHAFILSKNHVYTLSYHAYFTDVHDQKEGEMAFRRVSERMRLHFEQAPFAVIEWDTGLNVVEWNPKAERMFGFSKAEAIGKNAAELILSPEVLPQVNTVWSSLLHQTGGEQTINDNLTKEGKTITCEWYSTPLTDKEGTVIGVASIAVDISEKKQFKEKIEYLAYYDTLTGLPNRLLFKERLDLECRRADRNQTLVGVLIMDVDFFKTVNDSLGHKIGDDLLQSVASRLKKIFRQSDTISRFGGDEFAVVLPDLKGEEEVEVILRGLLERFITPFIVAEHGLYVTLSIGYSLYPSDGFDAESLIRDADIAMYSAKESGRNTYRRYHADMIDAVTNQMEIQYGLIHALKNQEFVLYYQPQYNLAGKTITGAEALIRWVHPQKGIISPAEFIPVAEKTGLIVPIGEWVLRTACQQLKHLETLGFDTFSMAINLSSRQFKETSFYQSVQDIIRESLVRPESIELELTESILIDNSSDMLSILTAFKHLGVKLSIDDFGTGYSSLSYLKLFPIDKVKIDQSFTQNATLYDNDRHLVQAIIAMSRALHLETIAEGIETEEQFELMESEGCDDIQGYLIAKPMPAAELETFLQTFTRQ